MCSPSPHRGWGTGRGLQVPFRRKKYYSWKCYILVHFDALSNKIKYCNNLPGRRGHCIIATVCDNQIVRRFMEQSICLISFRNVFLYLEYGFPRSISNVIVKEQYCFTADRSSIEGVTIFNITLQARR